MKDHSVYEYGGLCEASAATYIDDDHFAVASDETNTLRIYRRGEAGIGRAVPLQIGDSAKADLEAAARIGDLVYWISSHSVPGGEADRKRKKHRQDGHGGKKRRSGLVATAIHAGADGPDLQQVGLAGDLSPALLCAMGGLMAPDALNIEGMAATPDGRLMLGLRSILGDRAVVATLDNPAGILRGDTAVFGAVSLLDLGGMGIRSLEEVPGGYLMVAGPEGDAGHFAIHFWPGPGMASQAVGRIDFGKLKPEALMIVPGRGLVQFLCDDGSGLCSDVETPIAARGFHSIDVPMAALMPRRG